MVLEEDIAGIDPALRPILEKEMARGNVVFETWRGWPKPETVCVAFTRPFAEPSLPLPRHVVFREVNDPHYWKAEYWHEPSHHMLVCHFQADERAAVEPDAGPDGQSPAAPARRSTP
jgi:hypothetical protein